jgi:glycosyltransferase involved in cell wall biosynthesis
MNILFISEDISNYSAAFYQKDVLNHLKNAHTVECYGKGFDGYNKNDDINDVVSNCENHPELICVGHKWLRDNPSVDTVDPHPAIDFSDTKIPCVMILNKEYTNFQEKIEYIEKNSIPLVFTHHHKASEWSEKYNSQFVFWPFAVNTAAFQDYKEPKIYDLTFSGRLRNPNPTVPQTNLRIKVQQRLFYSVGQLKLIRRRKYRQYNIFWRGRPTTKPIFYLNKLLHQERRLPDNDYKKLYNRSKLSFNTLSPVNLVSTRYYEAMASNSLVFCQESPIYEKYDLFEPGTHCVTFKQDLSDFDEKLEYYISNDNKREKIAQRGHEHVLENHTWEKRIEEFTHKITESVM